MSAVHNEFQNNHLWSKRGQVECDSVYINTKYTCPQWQKHVVFVCGLQRIRRRTPEDKGEDHHGLRTLWMTDIFLICTATVVSWKRVPGSTHCKV